MQAEDKQTIEKMQAHDGQRRAEWGARRLMFCRGSRVVATLQISAPGEARLGSFLGPTEQEQFRAACREWIARGMLPTGAVAFGQELS